LEDIDTDHTKKLHNLVEAIEDKHSLCLAQLVSKYKTIIGKYKKDYLTESINFKNKLTKKIDKFFDIVVEETIPLDQLKEAVENTRHRKIVEQISKLISMSNIQENELVREGIIDAKNQIDSLGEKIKDLQRQNNKLITEKTKIEVQKLLNEKTSGLPKVKKEYIFKVLGDKSLEFIKENFDYTLKLYDNEEERSTDVIKEEATKTSKVISENVDRVVVEKEIKEPKQDKEYDAPYLQELERYK
jgi:hypothetical protein